MRRVFVDSGAFFALWVAEDALSFVVMERLRIREAMAFDRHFREHGKFVIL